MPRKLSTTIEQNLIKYNRESGKKTLLFVGIVITLIVIFTILSLILINQPKVLTSSISNESVPSNSK